MRKAAFLALLVMCLCAAAYFVQPTSGANVTMLGGGTSSSSSSGGGGVVAYESSSSDIASGTSDVQLSVPVPSGTASGDCLIFFGAADGRTITPPAGVTQINTSTTFTNNWSWYKQAGASESAFIFDVDGTYGYPSVIALRFSGAACSGLSDFTYQLGGSGSSNNVATCPNITPPEDDTIVVWWEHGDLGVNASSNNRGSATERVDLTSANAWHQSAWTESIATATALTGAQITRSGWSGYASRSIVLKAAP